MSHQTIILVDVDLTACEAEEGLQCDMHENDTSVHVEQYRIKRPSGLQRQKPLFVAPKSRVVIRQSGVDAEQQQQQKTLAQQKPQEHGLVRSERLTLLQGARNETVSYGTLPKSASTASMLSSVSTIAAKTKKVDVWFTIYLLAYVCFLVLGSVTFSQLELGNELDERKGFHEIRQRFVQKYSNIMDEDLEEFIQQVARLNNHGLSPLHNATNADLNWSFGQALFFSSTVITTIGYGHVTPLTQAGKLFCILYAIVGIPLTLVLLSAAVERLLVPVGWLLGCMQSRIGHLYQPFNIRLLHLIIIVSIFGTLFLALPTAVFSYLEPNWTKLDAFYYCFITLTTIGLGDYIPGDQPFQSHRSLYKICTTAYLLVGLVAVMLCMTIFYDIPQLNLGQLFSEQSASAAAAASGGATGCDGDDDTESTRLSLAGRRTPMCYSSGCGPSGLYIPQRDDEVRRSVVRIRPRGDESPSPDEEHAPMMLGASGGCGADSDGVAQ